jgi:adenylate cyclase
VTGTDPTQPTDDRTRRALLGHLRHELRTPINAIIGYSELLLEDAEEFEAYRPFLPDVGKILAAGRELLSLVNDILDPESLERRDEPEVEAFGVRIRHAMRTPINTVIGYCELLIEDADGEELAGLKADLEKVHIAANRLLACIADILTLPEMESGPLPTVGPEGADTAPIIHAIATMQAPSLVESTLGGTLLLVDDNAMNRALLVRRLERDGHRIVEACDGVEGLEKAREQAFDLVLLDIIMPGLNGYQVLQQLKADPELRHLPVVMLSSLDEIDSVVACVELGADDYLARPINPVLLRARIDACLEKKRLRDREQVVLEQLRIERAKSERLLLNILPAPIAERLKRSEGIIADSCAAATVLFADLAGFTRFASEVEPPELIRVLDTIFSAFDRLVDERGLEKIKTIGDSYMAAGGLLDAREDHVEAVADLALEMIEALRRINRESGRDFSLRVGLASGPVVAGVIGRSRFIYDLWGDTVNTASRMESHGRNDRVQVPASTAELLRTHFHLEPRGVIEVKGKGEMETWFLLGRKA